MDCLQWPQTYKNADVASLATEENDNTSVDNWVNYLTRKDSPDAEFENSLFRVIKSTVEEEEEEGTSTAFLF